MLILSKSKPILLAVLFTCVLIVLSSAAVFASSEETPLSSEVSLVIPDEYLDPVYDKLAAGDVRATYTVSDVYVLLNSALVGESNSSTYSLPRIAYYTWQTWSRLNTTNTRLSDILSALADGNSSNIPVGPGIRQTLFGIDGQGNWETVFDTSQDTRDLAQLIYTSTQQIHSDGQNNSYYLSQISNKLPSYNWVQFPSSYIGAKSDPNSSSFLSSTSYGPSFYLYYSIERNYSLYPNVLRIFVPLYATSNSYSGRPPLGNVTFSYSDGTVARLDDFEYFVEGSEGGSYIYVFDFNQRSTGTFVVHVSSSVSLVFRSDVSGNMSYIPFNTDEYQQLKQAFYQAKSANAQGSIASDVNRLADYLADPDKIAAEEASQQVIDDTLDGFTGSGSAAAKTSDTGSMKNMSGSLQSGLDSGASASNAASVFSNQTFWSWFTQATSDGINSPYPAPVVNSNTRFMSNGDSVPDFLSGNQAELIDLLNQRDSW